MPYNHKLAARVRALIEATHTISDEKEMFKGLCMMVDDKMCIVVHDDDIMVRINPDLFDELSEMNGCKPMVMKGKIMRGYFVVNADVLTTKKQLDYWVQLALDYNKLAKSSKKSSSKKAVKKK
jgi:TfoX/Sxy family transcriptional regulator of competence genes